VNDVLNVVIYQFGGSNIATALNKERNRCCSGSV